MTSDEKQTAVYKVVREAAMKHRRVTVSEVAERTGIARSTVANVAKALGYEGWSDFVTKLVHYFAGDRAESGALGECVSVTTSILRRNKGRLVLVDAVGDAAICVDYLLARFSECGYWAVPFYPGIVQHDRGEHDIAALIVLNESGMALLPSCIEALEAGCPVISITASHDTPISKLSSVNVVIKNNKSNTRDYKPNYFTAGALVFLEKVMSALERAEGRRA